ncbi:MAG: MotA/TolQ/ExbB proton channel family protein [Bacteroidota bacterium]
MVIVVAIFSAARIFKKDYSSPASLRENLSYIKPIGLFAMITGILGQLIGLYSAFNAIEEAGDVSPAMILEY